MRHYLAVFFLVSLLVMPWFAAYHQDELVSFWSKVLEFDDQAASVIFARNPKTVAQIKSRYDSAISPNSNITNKKVKILLVPGHEVGFGGAEYGNLREREMTVELAQYLKSNLLSNSRYEVLVTRDANNWNDIFSNYFSKEWDNITVWLQAHKAEVTKLTQLGLFTPIDSPVIHNSAPSDVAQRLYGIGKWANENDVDIIVHIHFNDYPGHGRSEGKYSGFAIYVPQAAYHNSSSTHALADKVFDRLAKYNAVSDLKGESAGIVPDPDLIALGAFNSLDAASMLIEYGYIYEPQFTNDYLRSSAIKDLAYQTYLGLQDFFEPNSQNRGPESLGLVKNWNSSVTQKNKPSEIISLQTALLASGFYPPDQKSLNECPRTGKIGSCTKASLDAFQHKYNITGEKGKAGPKTLNELTRVTGNL